MASVHLPRGQASVSSQVLKVPDWKDCLKAIGVNPFGLHVDDDDIVAEMVRMWKSGEKPMIPDLANQFGMKRGTMQQRVMRLVKSGRVLKMGKNYGTMYIPVPKEKRNGRSR